jgi:RNA polymerase sigma-70 factor, ECF subfamily
VVACVPDLWRVYWSMGVRELVASHDELYERAYNAHWRDVFRLTLAWTNDWAAAEDLTQETFLRLWRSRNQLDWSQPIVPWLLVTGRHLATDRFRALSRRVTAYRTAATIEAELLDQWLDVQSSLRTLSPLERTAVVLVLFADMSSHEAAEILDTTPGAIRAAISRAREKMEKIR